MATAYPTSTSGPPPPGHGAQATVTAVSPLARFGALQIKGDTVERFVEKPSSEGGRINGGFLALSPGPWT